MSNVLSEAKTIITLARACNSEICGSKLSSGCPVDAPNAKRAQATNANETGTIEKLRCIVGQVFQPQCLRILRGPKIKSSAQSDYRFRSPLFCSDSAQIFAPEQHNPRVGVIVGLLKLG